MPNAGPALRLKVFVDLKVGRVETVDAVRGFPVAKMRIAASVT
jgi:hypothetical protein